MTVSRIKAVSLWANGHSIICICHGKGQPMLFGRNRGQTEEHKNDRLTGQCQNLGEVVDGAERILGNILPDEWP